MNVVDCSARLKYFADGANAKQFAKVIETPDQLLVPSITLLEGPRASAPSAMGPLPSNASR